MQKHKLYILKGQLKNPNWELRNNNVRVARVDTKGKHLGLREIQFVPGAASIWKEDNKEEGNPQSIWFQEGSLSVDKSDKIKIEFIESHPDFSVKFELFDPEVKAEEEYKVFELVEKATSLLREQAGNEDMLAATAASLFGAVAMSWGVKQTKLRCFTYAKEKPAEVIDALNDPAIEAKYIAALSIKRLVTMTNPQKTAVIWNDKERGVICHVPAGQKALKVLGDFLAIEENLVTLQRIGDLIDEKDGKTKPKSKEKAPKE